MKSYVAWYVGCPESGKTYLALKHAREEQARSGFGVLLVDAMGEARNFGGVPRMAGLEDALIALHTGDHREVKWTPESFEEVEALARSLQTCGKLHVVFDESAFWINARRGADTDLCRLIRKHGHVPTTLHLTTQHYSADVPQEVRSCAPVLYVFCNTGSRSLKVLKDDLSLDPARVQALPQREFIKVNTGFSNAGP